MVTFDKHRITLQCQKPEFIDDFIKKNEAMYGKIEVIKREGCVAVMRYVDGHGYIAARQSERWSNKRCELSKQKKEW